MGARDHQLWDAVIARRRVLRNARATPYIGTTSVRPRQTEKRAWHTGRVGDGSSSRPRSLLQWLVPGIRPRRELVDLLAGLNGRWVTITLYTRPPVNEIHGPLDATDVNAGRVAVTTDERRWVVKLKYVRFVRAGAQTWGPF